MESSKARTYDKWGLDDTTVAAANPAIVICLASGYGQDGDPAYVDRASYDFTAQAFGGMMNLMGNPEPDPPTRAVPWTADYITALFCLWSSLAAYIYAQRTGQGQVIFGPGTTHRTGPGHRPRSIRGGPPYFVRHYGGLQ